MLALAKPRYFMPVHGEIKHLTAHAKLAESMGIPKENIQILKNGLILELREDLCQVNGNVQSGSVFVDGTGVGDVGKSVIEDRRRLSEDGLISVAITIDGASGQMVAGPEIVSRGFIYEKEAGNTMDYLRDVVLDACDNVNYSRRDPNLYRSAIRDAISGRIYEMCKRRPMIVCIVMEL